MSREWGFFRTMLSNMEMVLAKSNIGIASRYAELVPDRNVRDKIFQAIRTEWLASIDALLKITGQKELLQDNPALDASLKDAHPLSRPAEPCAGRIAQAAPRRRQTQDESILRAVQITINGISAGLRNSG